MLKQLSGHLLSKLQLLPYKPAQFEGIDRTQPERDLDGHENMAPSHETEKKQEPTSVGLMQCVFVGLDMCVYLQGCVCLWRTYVRSMLQ